MKHLPGPDGRCRRCGSRLPSLTLCAPRVGQPEEPFSDVTWLRGLAQRFERACDDAPWTVSINEAKDASFRLRRILAHLGEDLE